MLGFCCPGTLLLSAKYNLFCSRRCLKIGNMPSSERFFRQTKPIWRRNTWCIPRKIGNVWRKKSRRLGMLTIFKRALSQVKTWLRVFLWREGLTLTSLGCKRQIPATTNKATMLSFGIVAQFLKIISTGSRLVHLPGAGVPPSHPRFGPRSERSPKPKSDGGRDPVLFPWPSQSGCRSPRWPGRPAGYWQTGSSCGRSQRA